MEQRDNKDYKNNYPKQLNFPNQYEFLFGPQGKQE